MLVQSHAVRDAVSLKWRIQPVANRVRISSARPRARWAKRKQPRMARVVAHAQARNLRSRMGMVKLLG